MKRKKPQEIDPARAFNSRELLDLSLIRSAKDYYPTGALSRYFKRKLKGRLKRLRRDIDDEDKV